MQKVFTRMYCVAVFLSGISVDGRAQPQVEKDYPSRPVRFVVPFVAGGSMDYIGQVLGQKMAAAVGQNFFIDNRSGAGGAIGTGVVATAAPDGYTILLTSSGHAILPSISKSLSYDAIKDFAPITLVAKSTGSVLVVHPSVPVRSMREFIGLAKAQPAKLTYGSGGIGHVMHFAAESFSLRAGTRLLHVPYRGVGQAMIDLLAGRTDAGFVSATISIPHIESGKLRPLAITAATRWDKLADVPTMDEAGMKGYTYVIWYGMWFPAATPSAHVTRLRAEVAKALEDAATRRAFNERGLVPVASTPQEFAKAVADEVDYHQKLVARIGMPLQ